MYDRIHRYRKEDHRSVNWIAQKLQLNRRTVKRYLAMTQAEYERHLEASGERPLLLEPYTQFVVDRLNRFPDTKAAQMHDWLKEHYPDGTKQHNDAASGLGHRYKQQTPRPGSRRLFQNSAPCRYSAKSLPKIRLAYNKFLQITDLLLRKPCQGGYL